MPSKIIRKCENCGREQVKPAIGWTGTGGKSKYGQQYERRGFPWYCTDTKCQRVKDRMVYRRFFPAAKDDFLDAMIDQAEMEKIREN